MQNFYNKLKNNFGLSFILLIGLAVEFSNFQALFFGFMSQYRASWGAVNHIPAAALSAFLLLCIVIFGIRQQTVLSWFLALLTCIISFSVYGRMNLSWQWEQVNEVNFVVLLLSTLLPMLVAYTTHQIAEEDGENTENEEASKEYVENFLRDMHRLQQRRKQQATATSNNHSHTTNEETSHFNNHKREKSRHYAVADAVRKDIIEEDGSTDVHKSCLACGTALQSKRKGTKYCSKACSQMAHKRRRGNKSVNHDVIINPTIAENILPSKSMVNELKDLTNQELMNIFENNKGDANSIWDMTITEDSNMFSCNYCGKTTNRKNQHSKYCSEVCRISALRSHKPSDFFASNDQYATEGTVVWTNPHA